MAERIAVLPDRIIDTVGGERARARGPGRGRPNRRRRRGRRRSRGSSSDRTAGPHAAAGAHGHALPSGRRGGDRPGVRVARDGSGAQDAISGVRNARLVLEAGFTTVRDIGSFRAFTDVASARGSSTGGSRGPACCVPAPTSRAPAVWATSPAWRSTSTRWCRPSCGSASRAASIRCARTSGGSSRRRRLHQDHRDRRGAHERHEPGAPEFTEDEIRAAVEECERLRRVRRRATRTDRWGSIARCAPACARSSTPR